ncbi:Mediator of RNA polymerase II transcription subunit 18 [Bienertia sinuspersici]
MAIAGLHNVPVIESSILRDSQSSSSSGRLGNQGSSVSTRASSIRQMWLELEDECIVGNRGRGRLRLQQESNDVLSNYQEGEVGVGGLEDSSESENENGSVINSESLASPRVEHDDHQSMTSEQSQDFGVVERERVRRIFQEWKNNNGASGAAPNVPMRNRGSRGQWLGETERERVRIVREWIQMTSQSRDDQVGSQIEQVRDGQVIDPLEGQENGRRRIRRLCGRQALLDLLAKKEQERRQELQGLEVTRPVSRFAHRNRIQSLLRIRCFQNTRSAELRSPRSTAESELGLLRQRQTVSGLREGFLSRVDSFQIQASELSGGGSENNVYISRDVQTQGDITNEVVDGANVRNDPANEVHSGAHEEHEQANEVLNCAHQQNESAVQICGGTCEQSDTKGDTDVGASADPNQPRASTSGRTNLQQLEAHYEVRPELASDEEDRSEITTNEPANGSSDEGDMPMNFQEPSRSGSEEFSDLEETHEMAHHFETQRDEINLRNHIGNEVHVSEDVNDRDSSIQLEGLPEQATIFNESGWQGSVLSNQWRNDNETETGRQHWPADDEHFSHGALESEVVEQNDAQEDYWHGNGSLETPGDWLGMPSSSVCTIW